MDQNGLDGLKANEKNPRLMSKFDADNLLESMKEFGDLSGIIFNTKTGQLVGGHQRVSTFKRMDDTKQIVVEHRFDTPNSVGTVAVGYILYKDERYGYREVDWDLDREYAANIAANRISGEFDLDKLAEMDWWLKENNPDMLALTGQTDEEISKLLDGVGPSETEEDEVPEVDEVNPPVSKLGEIYQLGRHRLMCGDSVNESHLNALMNGAVASLVFTDPPYGVSYQSNWRTESAKFDVIENDDKLISEWIDPVLKLSTGWVFIWTSWKVLREWIDITDSIGDMSNMIIWDKGGGGIGDLTGTFSSDYEVALVFNRGAKITGDRLGSVWSVGKDTPSIYEHPTQKPVGLAEMAIKNTTLRDANVIDVFGGSGFTMLACEKLGRTSYTMELDPKYADVIRKRYWKHVNNGSDEGWEAGTAPVQVMEPVAA